MLTKTKLRKIEVLISKALTDSYIHKKVFFSVNNVSEEYYHMKQEINNSRTEKVNRRL